MDPESKQLLQNALELVEENNKMLHKIRGVQKRETLWSVLKYVVIIGIALGSFYYLEPYLNKVMDIYSSITGMEQSIKGASSDSSSLKDLLNKF